MCFVSVRFSFGFVIECGCIGIGSVNDYAVEGGSSGNYSAQFKDLGKLVSSINREILGKLSGSSASSSGDTMSR